MDINATLKELRKAIAEFYRLQDEGTPDADARGLELAGEIAAMADSVDEWLSKGGHLPSDWHTPANPHNMPVE